MRIIFIVFLVSMNLLAFSQGDNSYVPPAPNASGLMRYANFPVDLYSGTPQINLPITQISGRSLTVPISLSYHASGNKVQDVASWVGLGFSLNAGGVITRVVRGLPDEVDNGYCGKNSIGYKTESPVDKDFIYNVNSGKWDVEPDLFYYNFLGHAGKFVLDKDGQVVLLPKTNIYIQPAIGRNGTGVWIITDENGNKYTFGKDEYSKEQSTTVSPYSQTFISSWYLSEANTHDDADLIQFSYNSIKTPISYYYYIQQNTALVHATNVYGNSSCSTEAGTTSDANVKVTINNPVYLAAIYTSQGQVSFLAGDKSRDDLKDGKLLEKIVVKNRNSETISTFKLNYSYFVSDACTDEICKRLKLNSIDQVSPSALTLFSFEYNNINLPSRDSHAIDHWGYYNSNPVNSKIPSVTDTDSPCGAFHAGADRSADSLRSRANILTRIVQVTGGYTEFVYGPNIYLDDSGLNQLAGGVRIRVVRNCVDSKKCNETYYYYKKPEQNTLSSGIILGVPKYHYRSFQGGWVTNELNQIAFYSYEYMMRTSQSQTSLFDLNGYHIGYGVVTVRTIGKGYTLSYFTSFGDTEHKDITPSQYSYTILSSGDISQGDIASNIFPYTPNTSLAMERGVLVKREYYNESSKLLKQEIYSMKFDFPQIASVTAWKVGLRATDYFGKYYYIGKHYHVSKAYFLDQITTTVYDASDPGNSSKKATTVTNFNYAIGDHSGGRELDFLPRKIDRILPNGDVVTEENKYASEYYKNFPLPPQPEVTALQILPGQHRNPLVESISYLVKNQGITKYMLNGELNTYKEYPVGSRHVYPWQKMKLKVGLYPTKDLFTWSAVPTNIFVYKVAQYKTVFTALDYDSYGNVISTVGEDGIPKTLTWGNNNTLLASQTVNANVTTPALEQKTSYVHKQLVGATTITDANGLSTNYTYDTYNRLKLVKDVDGNIVNRYRYSYGSREALTASVSVSGALLTGTNLTFETINDVRDYGTMTYTWDFGDGTTQVVGSSYKVTHAYTTSGTYTIKLTKSNPEYGTATATSVVTIAAAINASICANGPVAIDLCGHAAPGPGSCTSGTITNSSSTTLYVTASGGCGSLTYKWFYINASGSEISLGTSTSAGVLPDFANRVQGGYTVFCRITDSCGTTTLLNIALSIFKTYGC